MPFSFKEFLSAKKQLPEKVIKYYPLNEIKEIIHLFGGHLKNLWSEYLRCGGYPEIVLSETRKEWLYSGLFSTYLEKDVAELIRKANYRKFQDYTKLMAVEIGKTHNRYSVSQILGRDQRTIEKFEKILTLSNILFRLTPFYTNIRKELSKLPRFYFIDTGLRNFLSQNSGQNIYGGGILESAVISEFLKYPAKKELHWWKTKGGAEVDLIVEKDGKLLPVEIKNIFLKQPKLTRPLYSFLNHYKPPKALFLTIVFMLSAKKRKKHNQKH